MDTNLEILLLAVTLIILGEVTYLLSKLPKASIKSKQRLILLDTSVIMDGRILGIATSGFIGGTLVIPRSVVGELQFLADNADAEKRARARYGLDVVSELQNAPGIDVELLQDGSRAKDGVDEQLLRLAKENSASICTIDYNLNKVAVVEGIQVLNINELAQGLRMAHLPGDLMTIELIQKGQDAHQAVGYLADGTMVVVEHAVNQIGQAVQVEVTRSLQTAAGKMMFARKVNQPKTGAPISQNKVKRNPVERKENPHKTNRSEAPRTDRQKNQITKPNVSGNPRTQRPKKVNHEDELIKLVRNQ